MRTHCCVVAGGIGDRSNPVSATINAVREWLHRFFVTGDRSTHLDNTECESFHENSTSCSSRKRKSALVAVVSDHRSDSTTDDFDLLRIQH